MSGEQYCKVYTLEKSAYSSRSKLNPKACSTCNLGGREKE